MSLREEMWKYEQITGESAEHVPIIKLGAFLDGYEMAIKTLKQESNEDCISRAKALEMLGDEPENWTDTEKEIQEVNDYRWFKSILEELPSVTPQQTRWIPVSERLPEDRELVLFSTKTDRVFEGRYFDDNTDRQWYSFRDDTFAWDNVVTAWMPLPEPYKESERV